MNLAATPLGLNNHASVHKKSRLQNEPETGLVDTPERVAVRRPVACPTFERLDEVKRNEPHR